MSKVYESQAVESEGRIYIQIPKELVEKLGLADGDRVELTLDTYKNLMMHTKGGGGTKNKCGVCGHREPRNTCKTCGREVCSNCWWAQGSVCAKCANIKWKKHY
jgi:bifunctional DNA-binding transcriptional regulator/antitoxin component of YhaV-PrlF toxin-antitoxin module